jgi:hypothetical protein
MGDRPLKYSLPGIIAISTIVRCFIAWDIDLGNDEVYYFTYAVQPDWNHFDHPPLVGLFIRLFTFNLHFTNEFFLRLPAIIGAAVNTWLIARCGVLIKNQRTGIIAAVLYNVSVYTSIISGIFILPDSVQVVFWLAAICSMLVCIHATKDSERKKHILLIGIWIGLAVMCKVHGMFLWLGFLGFIFMYRRSWFANPYLYLSLLITVFIISPILFWNINNHFITWQFHSDRVSPGNLGLDFKSLLVTSAGQILYSNPVVFSIYSIALVAVVRGVWFAARTDKQLLLWCSIPIILCTTVVSLFRQTLPHWSGPGFIGIMILSAAFLDQSMAMGKFKLYKNWLNASIVTITIVIVAGLSLVHFYPATLRNETAGDLGRNDATLDIAGWDQLLPAFSKIRQDDIAQRRMSEDASMVIHKWFPGGHIYYYVAHPLKMKLIGVGEVNDLHKFYWLNSLYGPLAKNSDGYFISPSNNFTNPAGIYKDDFQSFEQAGVIPQKRNGQIVRYWYIFRLKHASQTLID